MYICTFQNQTDMHRNVTPIPETKLFEIVYEYFFKQYEVKKSIEAIIAMLKPYKQISTDIDLEQLREIAAPLTEENKNDRELVRVRTAVAKFVVDYIILEPQIFDDFSHLYTSAIDPDFY